MGKRRQIALTIIGIAVSMVLIAAMLGWSLFAAVRDVESLVSKRVDNLFGSIDNDSFANAYGRETTTELRNEVSMAQFVELGQTISTRFGKLKSKSPKRCKLWQRNADTLFDVAYEAKFEKGDATIVARLKKESGQWRYLSFRIDSQKSTTNDSKTEL